MMFKRFLRSNILRHLVIFITLTAVFTAVFSIFIVGISADSFEPVEFSTNALNALFSMSDVNLYFSTNNSYVNYAFTFDSNRSFIDIKNTNPSAIFDISYFTFSQNSFYGNMPFKHECNTGFNQTATPNAGRYINYKYIVNFPINFYLFDTSLTFYFFTHASSTSVSVQYLDSDDVTHNITSSKTSIFNGNLSSSNFSYFSSGFVNLYSGLIGKSFVAARSVNSDYTVDSTYTYNNVNFNGYFFSVTINFDNSEYYDVSSLVFNFNSNSDNVGNFIIPYIAFDTSSPITFYEYKTSSGSVDLSYIEDMLDTIGGQLDDVNDKLDVITGDMPSEVAQELATEQQKQAQLQGDISEIEDKFSEFEDDLEWNRRYPEINHELVQPELETSVSSFWDFIYNPTELIPRMISFGCAMLILYVVFKRF